ncbi:hypothetical protein, partial [Gluconacetobacter entanii]
TVNQIAKTLKPRAKRINQRFFDPSISCLQDVQQYIPAKGACAPTLGSWDLEKAGSLENFMTPELENS